MAKVNTEIGTVSILRRGLGKWVNRGPTFSNCRRPFCPPVCRNLYGMLRTVRAVLTGTLVLLALGRYSYSCTQHQHNGLAPQNRGGSIPSSKLSSPAAARCWRNHRPSTSTKALHSVAVSHRHNGGRYKGRCLRRHREKHEDTPESCHSLFHRWCCYCQPSILRHS